MSPLTKSNRRHSRGRRGAVMAEFAFVLPIFLLAVIGVLEFGRAVMVQQILVNAAREGARRAIVPGATSDEVKALVMDYLENATLGTSNRKVAVKDESGADIELVDADPHDRIQVIVQLPYDDVGVSVPAIYSFFNGKLMKARVQMRKE